MKNEEQKPDFILEKGKENWSGSNLQANSEPIIDPGMGKPYIIRCFEFAKNPEFRGKLTKQELFNMHWRQIQITLWGDGLVPYEGVNPRLEFKKNGDYQIFILAEPRLRTIVADKPLTLQEIIRKS